MKTIIFIALLSSLAFAQTWNTASEITEITSSTKIASCVNKNGIHTVYWTNGGSHSSSKKMMLMK